MLITGHRKQNKKAGGSTFEKKQGQSCRMQAVPTCPGATAPSAPEWPADGDVSAVTMALVQARGRLGGLNPSGISTVHAAKNAVQVLFSYWCWSGHGPRCGVPPGLKPSRPLRPPCSPAFRVQLPAQVGLPFDLAELLSSGGVIASWLMLPPYSAFSFWGAGISPAVFSTVSLSPAPSTQWVLSSD